MVGSSVTRRLVGAALGTAVVGACASLAVAAPRAAHVSRTLDTRLCPFPLQVTVASRDSLGAAATTVLHFKFAGPTTITLENAATGRTAVLSAPGAFATDTRTGTVSFRGRQLWFWAPGNHVPFLSTAGAGRFVAPTFALVGAVSQVRVIDPCALVAPAPPATKPRTTRAPWPLPSYALSRVAAAGLTPVLGTLRRHDHVHLDVIVKGRKVAVPAGIGLAEPDDTGPCARGLPRRGDCASGHFFVAAVANSPLHTHSSSGLIHVESDRPATFTLGQFFDEWGVRLDASCLGAYCDGPAGRLRVFVNGRRASGNPRRVVLRNHQEVAVVYGGNSDFAAAPKRFTGGWPGLGCGGRGELSCLPG
jgi:hypothetical protein